MFQAICSRLAAGRPPAAGCRGPQYRPRLLLEPLEERCLLSNYTTGPLMLISNPDPLAGCPPGSLGAADVAVEPQVAVNPANPKNIAAIWIDHGTAGNAVGVTLDGGKTWQTRSLPGTTQCTGGSNPDAADPWLAFAPNGDLYAESNTFGSGTETVLINKSTDGGLTWSSPSQLNTTADPRLDRHPDKPSITADPTHPGYVYAVWNQSNLFTGYTNFETVFARTIDGGQTWEPARTIHSAPSAGNEFNWGHQIVVLPDGTLVCAFTEGEYKNNRQVALTLLRSSDQGQTWSDPISAVVQQPLIDPHIEPPNGTLTDPDTGQAVEAHPEFESVAVDRTSGNLYAVWLDGRFSNFQYNGIALSMSTDGGFTWSEPIQVNQTPSSVPAIDRQAWNPTVAVAANGTVAVSYYDFRNNTPAAGALTDYWLAYCRPSPRAPATNPANWSEVRLTDTSFDLEQAPGRFNGAIFLGDYEGLAATGNDFVAVWGMPDGSAANQESIFFRRAISGDGDMSHPVAAPSRVEASGLGSTLARPPGATDGSATTVPPSPDARPLPGLPGPQPDHAAAAPPDGRLAAARRHRAPRFLADLDAGLPADGLP
jgi:hypothetical protein